MKRVLILGVLVAAVSSAVAGTARPPDPSSTCSGADAVVDTRTGHSEIAAADSVLDTLLSDWGLSPFPGIFLNTNPRRGLILILR